jgi:hypothetical protein
MSSAFIPPLPAGEPTGLQPPPTNLSGLPPVGEPGTAADPPKPAPPGASPLSAPFAAASPFVAGDPPPSPDEELAEALRELLGAAAMPDLEAFETLLRATLRRTLAEHGGGPFSQPDLLRRLHWRLDALLGSRSYEEVVDARMRRFRVEEIHLLDRHTLGLASFASIHPSRHAEPRRAHAATSRLAAMLDTLLPDRIHELEFSKDLRALVVPGRWTWLAALVRGRPDPLARPDLQFALRRIEARFATPLADGTPVLQEIQPMLEECLLIHSPPSPLPS